MSSIFRFSQRCTTAATAHAIHRGTSLFSPSAFSRIRPLQLQASFSSGTNQPISKLISQLLKIAQTEKPPSNFKRNLGLFLVGAAAVTAAVSYELVSPTLFPDSKKDDGQIVDELKQLLFNPLLSEKFRGKGFCNRLTNLPYKKQFEILQQIFEDPNSRNQLARLIVEVDGIGSDYTGSTVFQPILNLLKTRMYQETSTPHAVYLKHDVILPTDNFKNQKLLPKDLIFFLHDIMKNALALEKKHPQHFNIVKACEWLFLAENLPDNSMKKLVDELIKSDSMSKLYSNESFHLSRHVQPLMSLMLKHDTGIAFLKQEIEKYIKNPQLTPHNFSKHLCEGFDQLIITKDDSNPETASKFITKGELLEHLFPEKFIIENLIGFCNFCVRSGPRDFFRLLSPKNEYELRFLDI